METHMCFTQLADAKVKVLGISQLKHYLTEKIPFWNGYPTVKFTSFGSEMFVHVTNDLRGKTQKHFFGFIEDVALNVQQGFYEEAEK